MIGFLLFFMFPFNFSIFIRKTTRKKQIEDPANKLWVWLVFIFLLVAMPPVWPVKGDFFGIPAWVIGAIAVSFITSGFICYVIFKIWRDPNERYQLKRKQNF